MINLIKNEFVKIFNKKIVFIFAFSILVYSVIFSIAEKHYFDSYNSSASSFEYQISESERILGNYDANDVSQAPDYANTKAMLETYKLYSQYDSSSAEYYLIENEVNPILVDMYYAQYVTKDQEQYDYYKSIYDMYLEKLKHYDWKSELISERDEVASQIKQLEKMKENNISFDYDELSILNIELECLNYRIDLEIPYTNSSKSNLIDDYKAAAIQYINLDNSDSYSSKQIEKEYYLAKYELDDLSNNRVKVKLGERVFAIWNENSSTLAIIGLVLICAGALSDEFSKGTIKQLLIRPFTRNEILVSKMISSFLAFLLFFLFLMLVNNISYDISCGNFGSLLGTAAVYNYNTHSVVEINTVLYALMVFISVLPMYLILFCVIFVVDILTTNGIAAIAVCCGVAVSPVILELVFSSENKAILPIYNWNFSEYLFGGVTSNIHASFGLGLLSCIITIVVLFGLAFYIFSKKEIKNQ